MILLAVGAFAQPAVLVDCAELGTALALVTRGGAFVAVDDPGDRVAVPQGRWTLRFLKDDLGDVEIRPDTVVIASFERATLQLAEWTGLDSTDRRLCKDLRKGRLPVPGAVLVSTPPPAPGRPLAR